MLPTFSRKGTKCNRLFHLSFADTDSYQFIEKQVIKYVAVIQHRGDPNTHKWPPLRDNKWVHELIIIPECCGDKQHVFDVCEQCVSYAN